MSTQVSARKIGKLSAIYMIGSFAPQIIAVLLTPVFTRYLEPAQMGIVNQAARLVTLLTFVVQFGFTSVLKGDYFRVELDERPSLVRTVLIGQTAMAALVCALLLVVGLWPVGDQNLAEQILPGLPLEAWQVYLVWALVVWQAFCDTVILVGRSVAQLNERAAAAVGVYFIRYLSQAVLGLAAVVGLGWLGLGRMVTIAIGLTLGAIAAIVVIWPYAKGSFDPAVFRRTLVRGFGFMPHVIAAFMPQTVTAWLLGRHWGSRTNGLFGAAVQLPQMTEVTMNAISSAVYPTLAYLMRDGSIESKRQQSRVYSWLALGIIAMSLSVSILSPIGIRILNAPAYHEAIAYAPILALAWGFTGLYMVVSNAVYFIGGGWWLSTASTAAAVTHFVLSVPLISRFGLWGASWSLVAGNAVLFLVAAYAEHRLYPLPWEYKRLSVGFLTALATGIADVWICQSLGWLESLPVKVALLAIWVGLLWLFRVVSGHEIATLTRLAAGFFRRRPTEALGEP
jgi:O-antigen/teichoic acid export membrane protein